VQLRRWLKGDKEAGGGNQQKKAHLKHYNEYLEALRRWRQHSRNQPASLLEVVSWAEPSIANLLNKFEKLWLTASTADRKSLKTWEHDETV
jgi:hypothetical protein